MGKESQGRGWVLPGVMILGMLGAAGLVVLQGKGVPEDNPEDGPEQAKAAPSPTAPAKDPKPKGKPLGELVAGLRDPDNKIRRESASKLIEIDSPDSSVPAAGVAKLVIESLKDVDADSRQLAAYVLGNVKAPTDTLVPALALLLRDQDKRVRRVAATAVVNVGRRNPKSLDPLLRDALVDKDADVRHLANFIQEQIKPTAVAIAPTPTPKEINPKEPPKADQDKIVGKPAPEIQGEDLDGVRLKLSDYREGRVLTFGQRLKHLPGQVPRAVARRSPLGKKLASPRGIAILRRALRTRAVGGENHLALFWDKDGAIGGVWTSRIFLRPTS